MNRNNRVLQNNCLELNFRETDQLLITLASPQTSFGVSFVTSQVTSQVPKSTPVHLTKNGRQSPGPVKYCPKICAKYRKIPKISPSICKAPKLVNAKNHPLNRLSKYKLPRGLYLKIALKYKVKQSNGKFPSNHNASLIDFETQVSLHR